MTTGAAETVTADLAAWVGDLRADDLTADAVAAIKAAVLDCLGVAVAATTEPIGEAVVHHTRTHGRGTDATLLGTCVRGSATDVAFANGVLSHALDFDDTWAPPAGVAQVTASHPTCTLVPAVLAVAETSAASGADVLAAFAAGFEVHGTVGFPGRTTVRSGFHGSAVFGALGASAAAARVLGLDARGVSSALALGAASAAGINVNRGTMAKPFQIGNVAAAAVRAAQLAAAGFDTPDEPLTGSHGFAHNFLDGTTWDPGSTASTLGRPYAIVSPGVEMKRHASCFLTHRAIDAVLQIVRDHRLSPEDVSAIHITAPVGSIVDKPEPASGIAAKFSLQFTAAQAVVNRDVGAARFRDTEITDVRVRAMAERVVVHQDPSLDSDFPLLERPVSVHLHDGRVLADPVRTPPGLWVAPMGAGELEAKFVAGAAPVLGHEAALEVIDLVHRLEELPDVFRLAAFLAIPTTTTERTTA